MSSFSYDVNESHVVWLIMGYYRKCKLYDSLLTLALETSVSIFEEEGGSELQYLQRIVLEGRWQDVLQYVEPLLRGLSDQGDQMLFAIKRQQYLEHLSSMGAGGHTHALDPTAKAQAQGRGSDDEMEVVLALLKSLEHACPSAAVFDSLCYCLTLDRLTDNPDYAHWAVASGRVQVVDSVAALIRNIIPQGRAAEVEVEVVAADRGTDRIRSAQCGLLRMLAQSIHFQHGQTPTAMPPGSTAEVGDDEAADADGSSPVRTVFNSGLVRPLLKPAQKEEEEGEGGDTGRLSATATAGADAPLLLLSLSNRVVPRAADGVDRSDPADVGADIVNDAPLGPAEAPVMRHRTAVAWTVEVDADADASSSTAKAGESSAAVAQKPSPPPLRRNHAKSTSTSKTATPANPSGAVRPVLATATSVSKPAAPARCSAWDSAASTISPLVLYEATCPLRCVAMLPQLPGASTEHRFVVGSNDKCVSVLSYGPAGAGVVREWAGLHRGSVYCCDAAAAGSAADGALIASGSNDKTVRLRRFADSEDGGGSVDGPPSVGKGHTGTVRAVAFSPAGAGQLQLASGGAGDCTTRLWDVNTAQCVATFADHGSAVHGLTWLPSGSHSHAPLLLSGDEGGLLVARDTRSDSICWRLQLNPEWFDGEETVAGVCRLSAQLAGDQLAVAVGRMGGFASVLQMTAAASDAPPTASAISTARLAGDDVRALSLLPAYDKSRRELLLLATSFDASGSIWSGGRASGATGMRRMAALDGHEDKVLGCCVNTATDEAITTGADGKVLLWRP